MKKIGGNVNAVIQIKTSSGKNFIGENIENWTDALTMVGFLDYSSGQNNLGQYNAKVQETTHFFFCDFDSLEAVTDDWLWDPFNFETDVIISQDGSASTIKITSENCRMVIGGNIYNVILIDDPMGMHQHLEVYLKFVGGGLGV